MEELRQTAFAYYKDAPEQIRRWVDEFFLEMDHDGDDRVSLHEFLTYMEMHEDCMHLSNPRFFDELKKEGSEELDFLDVVTLFYIVYSGKPFCNGDCKKFVKGVYFTCVKCFDHASDAANTFNVCTACYVDGKYVHGHKKFLDNFLLLQTKRMEALNQLPASSIHEVSRGILAFFLFFICFSISDQQRSNFIRAREIQSYPILYVEIPGLVM